MTNVNSSTQIPAPRPLQDGTKGRESHRVTASTSNLVLLLISVTWASAQEPVRLTSPQFGKSDPIAGQFQFRLQGHPDQIYAIEASSNLFNWTVVSAYRTPPAGTINLIDRNATLDPRRFYRVVLRAEDVALGLGLPTGELARFVPSASNPNQVYPLILPAQFPILGKLPSGPRSRSDRILVKPRPGVALGELAPLHLGFGVQSVRTFTGMGNLQVLQLPLGTDVQRVLEGYRLSGLVAYAEPDFLMQALAEPNDFRFRDGSLWNLHNLGQSGGVPDADIDGPEAWDVRSSASDVVVAVIDTGVRYTHEDLAGNMWRNPGEIPGNGRDDDNNGYVDDVFGINAIRHDGDPADDHGHGTHVAGIIGAVGNNEVGVAGVVWKVQIMACKFITAQAEGALSDAIACIDYARQHGAKVINASWGLPEFNSQALRDAIESARQAGIIVAAAAGNSGRDNEEPANAIYPASFDLDNIIAVLATTRRDELAFFSNYGATKVDIGAPGLDIFSAWGDGDSSYQYFVGTSMAAAHVSGACALAVASFPGESYQQIVNRVLAGADPIPSLSGRCRTGGRLNLQNVIGSAPRVTTVSVTASDAQASEAGPDAGQFTFTRTGSTASALTVKFSLTGAAVNGVDYSPVESSATIPAGQVSATLAITPIDDTEVENNETVVVTLVQDAAYTIGSPDSATVIIADNDTAPPPPPPPPPASPTVTVTASDATAAEAGAEPGEFTVTRTGDTAAALTVNFAMSGTAGNGSDYQQLGTSVTIPVGAASAAMQLTPIDDTAVEESETAILTLSANQAYTIGSANTATVTIADNDTAPPPPPPPPTVTVTASDATAAEAGAEPGEFTITRTGDTAAALTINFTMSGTAGNGSDYQQLGTSVTIPAGAASAVIRVTPIDDTAVEESETAILTLSANQAYTVGSANAATVTIADNDTAPPPPPPPPTVTVTASDATAAEAGAEPGEFTVTRTGDTAAALTVNFAMSGTAGNGSDYQQLGTSVTIPAGAASAAMQLTPIDDTAVEESETAILTLSANPAYTVGSANAATVTIADNDTAPPPPPPPAPPTVTVIASDATAAEAGAEPGEFTVSRTGGTTASLTVNYALSGTASNGTDYQQLGTSVTIPAGAASARISVRPIDDTAVEGNETVILTLSANPAYTVGSPNTATVTIADNDTAPPPTVTVTASDATAAEAASEPGEFTISRTGSSTTPLTVRFTLSGTAGNGTDYQSLPLTTTIPAGASSVRVRVIPINDSAVEPPETVILTLQSDPGYVIGGVASAVVTIIDNDVGLPGLP